MSALEIRVTLAGNGEADMLLARFRNSLSRLGPMHARMAVYGQRITKRYLIDDSRHESAARLGASPTSFRKKAAARVEALSDEESARVVIPRNTGLGRAFADVVLRPGSGKTYLTIPAHATTYGRSVRDFPEGTFKFAVIRSFRVFLAQVYAAGPYKGEVGYWLRRVVTQKQDRTLLPPDEEYAAAARGGAVNYITQLLENPNGPAGGTSTGFPSALPT